MSNHTPEIDLWMPSAIANYDRSIHSNPDAKAWADFFVEVYPWLKDKHDLMIGWFANAMMAMHDHIHSQPNPLSEQLATVTAQRDEMQARLDTELANGWQSMWYKAIQCGAAVERQRDTLKAQRDELLDHAETCRFHLVRGDHLESPSLTRQMISALEKVIAKCEVAAPKGE